MNRSRFDFMRKVMPCAFICSVFFVSSAYGVQTTGKIKEFYINKSGLVLFALDVEVNQRPSCANNSTWQYAFVVTQEPAGKEMYSFLLAAKASGQTVKVGYGISACHSSFPAVALSYIYTP